MLVIICLWIKYVVFAYEFILHLLYAFWNFNFEIKVTIIWWILFEVIENNYVGFILYKQGPKLHEKWFSLNQNYHIL